MRSSHRPSPTPCSCGEGQWLRRPRQAFSCEAQVPPVLWCHPGDAAASLQLPGSLQIFNLEAKAKLKSVQFGQQVVFWKWISATKLGLVTATAVYHWDMQVRR